MLSPKHVFYGTIQNKLFLTAAKQGQYASINLYFKESIFALLCKQVLHATLISKLQKLPIFS
jgi:hypothetical protein